MKRWIAFLMIMGLGLYGGCTTPRTAPVKPQPRPPAPVVAPVNAAPQPVIQPTSPPPPYPFPRFSSLADPRGNLKVLIQTPEDGPYLDPTEPEAGNAE